MTSVSLRASSPASWKAEVMTNVKAPSAAIEPTVARRYLLSVLAGLATCCALFLALLVSLNATGNLPPPAFANSLCTDEKLSFLRDQQIESPNLLVIGSSVAWRHIDSETLVKMLPGTRPLNAGFCGLTANQSAFVANWMLDRYQSVRHVLMVVAPQDLTRCTATRTEIFNRADADKFVFGHEMRWPYYFKYFDPISLARGAATIKDRRMGRTEFDDLVMTRFGDGPLDTKLTREMGYEDLDPIDPACLGALEALVARLNREGRTFSIVTTPIHPGWIADGVSRSQFVAEAHASLATLTDKEKIPFWNAATEWVTPKESFTDAIHLRWSVAKSFTAAVAQHLSGPLSHGPSDAVEHHPGPLRRRAMSALGEPAPERQGSTTFN
jgi:hypothetical protein